MSFSPFDPAVMRRVLGRPAPPADPRGVAQGPVDRLERGADFETARMNDAYRQMEQAMRELLAHPFIREDAEILGRFNDLLWCVDMDDFAHRFDLVARLIEVRLENQSTGRTEVAGAFPPVTAEARSTIPPAAPVAFPAGRSAIPAVGSVPTKERDGNAAPQAPGQRMRLNL